MSNYTSSSYRTALVAASFRGDRDGVQFLLDMPLPEDVTEPMKKNFCNVSLLKAAHGNHEGVVRILLAAGAAVSNTNSEGNTALHLAAEQGHMRVSRGAFQLRRVRTLKRCRTPARKTKRTHTPSVQFQRPAVIQRSRPGGDRVLFIILFFLLAPSVRNFPTPPPRPQKNNPSTAPPKPSPHALFPPPPRLRRRARLPSWCAGGGGAAGRGRQPQHAQQRRQDAHRRVEESDDAGSHLQRGEPPQTGRRVKPFAHARLWLAAQPWTF